MEVMQLAEQATAYIDGGSRGNPGPAAAAFIITDQAGKKISAKAFFLGETTNNIAEYTALCRVLEAARKIGVKKLTVLSDSQLLVKQITGSYKVKSSQIKPLFDQAVNLIKQFESFYISFIPRQQNQQADSLVNKALNLGRDVEELPQPTSNEKPIRLGILISGSGRTLMNILEHIKQGKLNAEVAVVISSRSTVLGVQRAIDAGLDVKIIRRKDYPDIDDFSRQIEQQLAAAKVDLVVQAGWLCLWKIPARYENRVMNIHPALLPSFGGKGMWGHHVHQAVLAAGCKVSGCTVHFCTNEYDKGPIIIQRCCEVKENDTPETLAARVFEQECIAYPQAIRLFQQGKLRVEQGIVKIS